ncbi:hypothetical protein GCM10029964_029900 [Kibdelosporangium lantanae]
MPAESAGGEGRDAATGTDRLDVRLRLPRWPLLVASLALVALLACGFLLRVPVSGAARPLLFAVTGW